MAEYKKSNTGLILGGNKGRDHSVLCLCMGAINASLVRYLRTTDHSDNRFEFIFPRYPGTEILDGRLELIACHLLGKTILPGLPPPVRFLTLQAHPLSREYI